MAITSFPRACLAGIAFASLLAPAAAGAAGTAGAADPKESGVWYDDSGEGAVKIEVCGGKLCGRIYWLKDPLNDEGKPLHDRHNPNEGQRNRPICGLPVIGGLANMPDGEWDAGWIYDPKEGKSYSVALKLEDPNTLKVTGYLVMKLMGRTLTWKRAPADLPACTQSAAASPAPAPATGAADKAKPAAGAAAAATPAPAKAGAAKTGEALPWADKKSAGTAKPAPEASKLGGPKSKTPAKTQQIQDQQQ